MNKMILKNETLGFDGESSVNMTFVDEDYDKTQITVKWDGCCDITKHSNSSTVTHPSKDYENDMDYIHICDLKEFIDLLEQVYENAVSKGYEV